MNLINGKFRIFRHAMLFAAVMMAAFFAPPIASAAQSTKSHILILNSFDESSPWVQEYINGLIYHLVNVKGVSTNVRHLDANAIVNDSTFDAALNSNLDSFADNPPSGIIMMGRPAFAAREEINRRWKNIPMLYMGATEEVIPKEYEYAYVDISDAPVVSIHDIRDRYNFTFVKIPDHYRQTIDMMMKMQPKMKNFKFASNSITTSLQLRDSVRQYLGRKYPDISFEWINADDEGGSEKFKNLLAKRDLETGVLLGNWYHRETDQTGHSIYSAGDVNLIDKSPQPVFTVKENYFKTGVIGGVFPVRTDIMKRSKEVIDRMLDGDDMRQIPLDKGEKGGACIDYPQIERKGLDESDVPANTSFINKPQSLFSKNPLAFAVALLILISLVQLVMYYLLFKGKTESFMKRREIKINHLPVNYFIGKVNYNEDGVPVQVETTPGNQKAIELWERHAGECRCEPLFDEAEMLKAVARLSDDGKGVVYTEHFKKTDSYYNVNIHRGFDPDTLEIFCFNITKRIQSEQDLKYTSALLEMTLDLAQIVPWHWNIETKKIQLKYNEALRKINRNLVSANNKDIVIPEEQLFGMINHEDIMRVKELINELKEGKRRYIQMEFRVVIPENGKRVEEWIEVNASVEKYNSEKKAEVLIGSFACITERKEQMRRLIEARETAKEADRLKSAFLANMSHEIRTPLNAIVGFSNMLAETDDPVQKQKFINIIESNNDMLLQIISDILDLSKTEAGTMEFNMRPTDVNALLVNIGESVVDRVKPGVDLLCNFGAQCCWIDTDPNRLSQVVINFLTNASKFTETGNISFGYEVRGESLYFYCHDTGSGISEENQKKVFERFIKLNSFVNGTGLGLPICKAIVEFLGGQIGVYSEGEGFGSTFWFEIPYTMVDIPEDEVAPLWTEPTVNLTIQHALSMPDHSGQPESLPEHAPVEAHADYQPFVQNDTSYGYGSEPPYGTGAPYGPGPDASYGPVPGAPYGPGPDAPYGPVPGAPYGPGPDAPYGPGMPYGFVPGAPYPVAPNAPFNGMEPSNSPAPADMPMDHTPVDTEESVENVADEKPQPDAPEVSEEIVEVDEAEIILDTEDNDAVPESEDTSPSEEKEAQDDLQESEAEMTPVDNEENESIETENDNNSQETEDMAQQMNPNQPWNPNAQGYPQNGQAADPRSAQYPNAQNPYGQQPQQNPYGQQQYPQQNPYGQQQYPQQNPYGQQQYPQQNPYGQQQYPQQNPYGQQQYPQQNPYGQQQYPQQNPYGQQQYPQQNPYGQQQYPQQNPYGQQQYPQQNPYGQQQYPQQNPYGQQQYPQQNPYGQQQYPQQNPYGQQQYPQQNPYGQQYPQQNPYGQPNSQQGPQQNPYGQPNSQQGPQQNPYGQPNSQRGPQQNSYGQPNSQQGAQQNPYGQPNSQQGAQHNSYGQSNSQQGLHQNPYGQPNMQQAPLQNPYVQQPYPQPSGQVHQQPLQPRTAMGQPQGHHFQQSPAGNPQTPAPIDPSAENADPDSKKIKVLIAEDNESNYFLYESMLSGNYELIHAWDGEEAVQLFEQTKPDIILMDISMPKMDGYEATTEIKRKDSLVPIIAVTAYAFATDKERMLESGFNGYISKPINSNRLKEEMTYVLKHK